MNKKKSNMYFLQSQHGHQVQWATSVDDPLVLGGLKSECSTILDGQHVDPVGNCNYDRGTQTKLLLCRLTSSAMTTSQELKAGVNGYLWEPHSHKSFYPASPAAGRCFGLTQASPLLSSVRGASLRCIAMQLVNTCTGHI